MKSTLNLVDVELDAGYAGNVIDEAHSLEIYRRRTAPMSGAMRVNTKKRSSAIRSSERARFRMCSSLMSEPTRRGAGARRARALMYSDQGTEGGLSWFLSF